MFILVFIQISMWFVMAFASFIPSRPHSNIILENTLPHDKLRAPVVTSFVKKYRRGLLIIAVIGALSSVPLFFIRYDSILMTVFMLELFVCIGIFYLYQIHNIHKLHELQAQMGWLLKAEPILIDTQAIQLKNRKIVPFRWLIGSLALTILAIVFSVYQLQSLAMNLILIISAVALWLLCFLMYYFIRRFPVKAWSKKTELNQQYNDLTKFYWSLIAVILSYLFIPLILMPYVLLAVSSTLTNLLTVFYFVLLFVGCIGTVIMLFDLRKKQDQLMMQTGEQRYSGDDQYWRYGMYYNPNDTRWMIPDRVGLNISMNMAKPGAKVGGIILAVAMLGLLIFVSVPLYQYDFQTNSIQMTISDSEIVMKAPLVGTSTIATENIESVELIDHLPTGLNRINGMGSENYLTGSFAGNGRKATLYVRRDQAKIIYIKTAERDYYFTGTSQKQTESDYQTILNDTQS